MEYDIERFIIAQERDYDKAFKEIKSGLKQSHWMWYIFPQLKSLGHSQTAKYYGITNLEEAKDYYNNVYLKNNLINICQELLLLDDDIENIFGYPDYLKLKSCMTLFELVDDKEIIFKEVLNKFFSDERDEQTKILVKSEKEGG